jgi:uncharacterized protein
MTTVAWRALQRLDRVLDGMRSVVVAVSGGVDSLTLMAAAHRRGSARARAVHAASPAVPAAALERLHAVSRRWGWDLEIVDAGELQDPDYRRNPVDRCYFCKSNLYRTLDQLARRAGTVVVSGANLDDLSDFRPGLEAARQQGVRHPLIEAAIDKAGVRQIARSLHLGELAELAASPCLSSRVETGIVIDASLLLAIDRAETAVREALGARVVRCRIRRHACEIELGDSESAPTDVTRDEVGAMVAGILREAGVSLPVTFGHYRRGSAFVGTLASI